MIFTSGHAPVPVPNLPFSRFVLQDAARRADRVATVDVDGVGAAYTYGQLTDLAGRAAAGLRARGYGHGDVVAVLAPNVPEYPIVFHAAALAGCSVMLLNHLDTPDELAGHLDHAGARLLVTVPADADRAQALARRTSVEEVVVLGTAADATAFTDLLGEADPAAPGGAGHAGVDPVDDVVALLHSSGSTGLPKAVMLTHRNMVAKVLQTSIVAGVDEGERVLAMPPFHHAFGLVMVMNASLLQGATIVTMQRFEPEAYLRAIQEHRITRLYVVPTLAVLLAKSPLVDRYDLSSVRSIVSGGATLDPAIAQRCRERLGCSISQGYGLTEALVSFMQEEQPLAPASVGRSAPNTEFKIVDAETGEEFGPGRDGEILIRGPHVMKGYLGNAEATRKAFDADGFLRTGDLGHVDEDGELFIVDRIKELIKYKGQQVSPVELEAVLVAHPGIADAAVIGVPDEEAGEIPKALVVPQEPLTADGVMGYVAERVAPYKKVREVEFVDRIPRTPVGKIERRTLKEREQERRREPAVR